MSSGTIRQLVMSPGPFRRHSFHDLIKHKQKILNKPNQSKNFPFLFLTICPQNYDYHIEKLEKLKDVTLNPITFLDYLIQGYRRFLVFI